MNVQPSMSFEAVSQFTTGLTGSLGVRIDDNAGSTTVARVTAGIAEYPASSGIYAVTLTAPGTAGQYTIVWDDGSGNYAIEDLLVTSNAAVAPNTSNVYCTRDEIKSALSASNTSFLDDDIDVAAASASRAIDDACYRRFYPTTETRVYTPGWRPYTGLSWYGTNWMGVYELEIDDLNTLTTLKVDNDGDGVYETTWTRDVEFFLDPPNAALNGYPYERVVLRQQNGARFPGWANSVQIAGSFGWAETPTEVRQYCKIFATQLLLRSRQAPFGVLMAGMEIGATARISRMDPDFDRLLGHLVKPRQLIA